MNYYGTQQLVAGFKTVRNNTIIIAEEIPEDQYAFQVAPETRSVGRMLTHIALSSTFQYRVHAIDRLTTLDGLDFPSLMKEFMAEEQVPRSKTQIIELLRQRGEKWSNWVKDLSEEFLGEEVAMPAGSTPAAKSRFEMLLSVKEHEMHHRGQLMLIERQLGIVPHLTRAMQERMASSSA